MESFDELYLCAKEKIIGADNIAVVTHINPDGDCMGSAAALKELIKNLGKDADIYNENGCPAYLEFAQDCKAVSTCTDSDSKYDLVICVDCGSVDRAGKVSWVLDSCKFMINIDHHATNTMFADINIVDPSASATGLLIYDFFVACSIEITKRTAELLYTAVATDTGNFSYANTDKRTHIVAGELVDKGIDVAELSRRLFRATTYNRLKLTQLALGTLTMYCNGKVAVMNVTKAMFSATGTDSSDSEGFVGYARDIDGVEVAAMLRDTTDGKLVKVSLRSNSNVDVSKIAEDLGGGGHFNAAGFSMEGKIPDVEKILIEKIAKVIL